MGKSEESAVSTLLRIMTNYIQVVTLSLSFSLNYPKYYLDSMLPVRQIGDSTETFLSFDCFLRDTISSGALSFFPSIRFLKAAIAFFVPPAILFTLTIGWTIFYCLGGRSRFKKRTFNTHLILSLIRRNTVLGKDSRGNRILAPFPSDSLPERYFFSLWSCVMFGQF